MKTFQKAISEESTTEMTKQAVNGLSILCHGLAVESGWWHDPKSGEKVERNKGEMLCLIHSEISEAMEGARKNLMDDHLSNRKMEEVELADALIRIFDYAGAHGFDLGGAVIEKLQYNQTRKDHSKEARLKDEGKKFNINDYVKVKLNNTGLVELKRQHDELIKTFPRLGEFKKPKVDEGGYSKFQLHELMQRLGHLCVLGFEPPFDTEIIILKERS